MNVFILFGSDDYIARKVLAVYDTRDKAEAAIEDKRFEGRQEDGFFALICRQGSPLYRIEEKTIE